MQPLIHETLTIEVVAQPACVRLDWTGRSGARQPGSVLRPFLDRVAVEAAREHARIELHFEKLEYFNSSTISALIQFAQQMRRENQPLACFYNAKLAWQRNSFEALRFLDHGDTMLSITSV